MLCRGVKNSPTKKFFSSVVRRKNRKCSMVITRGNSRKLGPGISVWFFYICLPCEVGRVKVGNLIEEFYESRFV